MTAVLTSLLCLGLSLGQRLQAQAGIVPRPTIWAEPGSTVMRGRTVTIWCQGSLEAMEYHLHKEGTPEIWDKQQPLEPSSKAKFCIQQMTVDYAGRYRCSYVSNTGMSALSYPLDLVLTGVYDSPTLSALPSTGVTSGGSVMLQCGSSLQFDRFTLCREGDQQCSWTLDSKQASRGLVQAVFSVGPVTPSHTWTFRCYGHFNSHPHVWSSPSDALQLLVSALPGSPSPPPIKHNSTVDLKRYLPVLIGVSMAFALLLFLLLLLLLLRRQRQRKESGAADSDSDAKIRALPQSCNSTADIQEEDHYATMSDFLSQAGEQTAEADNTQTVPYAQLNSVVLGQKATTHHPSQPGEPSALSSVYVVLTHH